tara:strand:+ start:646 stop:849 length:204 start_codon:yes stop_codon:yes gene_type:complete
VSGYKKKFKKKFKKKMKKKQKGVSYISENKEKKRNREILNCKMIIYRCFVVVHHLYLNQHILILRVI